MQNYRDILSVLISFDTTSRNSNMAMIDWVVDYLEGFGVESTLFHNPDQPKANLLATIGPKDKAGILLSGHSDVVPVDGQNWSSNPFELTERNDRMFGRGTADMKGFLALALALVPKLVDRPLKIPVHIAMSYDEEIGCSGVMPLVEHVAKLPVKPWLCLIGEPTLMKVVNAHKGVRNVDVTIKGKAGHASKPAEGANALAIAAELIGFIEGLSLEVASIAPDELAEQFSPPHSTINVGKLVTGSAHNVIPEKADLWWEYRTMPGQDPEMIYDRVQDFIDDDLLPRWQKKHQEVQINMHISSDVPPLQPGDDGRAEAFVMALARANDLHTVAFATEAAHFHASAGIPSIVCGPGSIDQAHQADEYITLEQLEAGWGFLNRLIDQLV